MTPKQAKEIVNRLLTERRLSQWESGWCRALQPHLPTAKQVEVAFRLAENYNMDLTKKRETSSERDNFRTTDEAIKALAAE
jgi:hypothetical protein